MPVLLGEEGVLLFNDGLFGPFPATHYEASLGQKKLPIGLA